MAHFTHSVATNGKERQRRHCEESVSEGLGSCQKIGELSQDSVLHFSSTPASPPDGSHVAKSMILRRPVDVSSAGTLSTGLRPLKKPELTAEKSYR